MKKILVINGPNLNLIEYRNSAHYGQLSLESIQKDMLNTAEPRGYFCEFFQSNWEGAIIDRIQSALISDDYHGLIINPGAFSHYSIAIRDALEMLKMPIIEVHLSNLHAREGFRHESVTAAVATGVIAGLKGYGYLAALDTIMHWSEGEGHDNK